MKFAPVVPIAHLDLTLASDYHMALAHLILKYPEYEDFYARRSDEGDFVLVDNGVIELGHPMLPEAVATAARRVKATEVVLPDAVEGYEANMAAFHNAINCPAIQELKSKGTRLQFVPHGGTPEEIDRAVNIAIRSGYVDTIGLGKPLMKVYSLGLTAGRSDIAYRLDLPCRGLAVHFLSFYTPVELLGLQQDPAIRGCDSSLPILAAMHNVRMGGAYGLLHRPREWKFDPHVQLDEEQVDIARQNIRCTMRLAGAGAPCTV